MHITGKLARLFASIADFFHRRSGFFQSDTFSNESGSHPYKLYVPRNYSSSTPVPLLVALHGCSQGPDNFAAATRFNTLADDYHFLVLYPQQSSASNVSRCWNWFIPANQERGSGEPAILAGMVDSIRSKYTVDPQRIFITGMSAGGAMAVIMGACYPDYFAAIGVHSGLEYKAALDALSAQAAMIQGGPNPDGQGQLAYLSAGPAARVLPVIVFHGAADFTIAPLNGEQVIQQFIATDDYADDGVANNSVSAIPSSIQNGQVPGGYLYTIYSYSYQGQELMQQYSIIGMGHAWSGGSTTPPATFVDPLGPDASLLMWNFFAAHPKAKLAVPSSATPLRSVPEK